MTSIAVEKVVGCIGDKLEASSVAAQGRLSTRPTENGYSIADNQIVAGYGSGEDTIILVDISKVDGGTRVQVYTHFMSGDAGMPALIRTCL